MISRTHRPNSCPFLAAALSAAVLAVVGGCSRDGTNPGHTPSASPPRAVTLDEHAARSTVHVRTGTAVLVGLHSTYWSTPASSDTAVLVPAGPGGSTPGGTCVPGGGCGVSAARFTAAHPGTVHVTAHRNSCGEAMPCVPGRRDYEVTVMVTG
jgi:hypothetical protein